MKARQKGKGGPLLTFLPPSLAPSLAPLALFLVPFFNPPKHVLTPQKDELGVGRQGARAALVRRGERVVQPRACIWIAR